MAAAVTSRYPRAVIALAPCLSTLLAAALAATPSTVAPRARAGAAKAPATKSSASPRAQASATFAPATVRPGDPVALVVRGVASEPHAELAGRALQFHPAGAAAWRAIAGLPLEQQPGPIAVDVRAGGAQGANAASPGASAGASPTSVATASLTVVEPHFRETRLTVPPRYTEPRSPEVEARVAEDRAAFLAAFTQPPAPPLFRDPFRAPRRAPILGRFGDLRTFNGEVQSQHYGTDFRGRVGDPVLAANDGRVTMVRDAWASGLSVVVFHGAGLHTVYFHLSEALVKEGDAVKRGQRIGRVGASGRSTGPHLHWGARVGDLYVDPEALLRLKLEAAPRPPPQRSAARRS